VTLAVAAWLGHGGNWLASSLTLAAGLAASAARQSGGKLRLRDDGRCELDGDPAAVGIQATVAGVFQGAGWMILRLTGARPNGEGRWAKLLVLAPDAAQSDDLRQLRVWLTWVAGRAQLNSRSA
jgi:hypothetical protein